LVDPCIPPKWDGFRVKRRFRKATYIIEVENKAHVAKGIKTLLVDGEKIEGNVVPVYDDGNEHTVRVIM